jgi:hypothetical protein
LVGSILGRSSIKIAHLVPIRLQTWPTQAILVSDWLISKKSSPLKPHGQMNRNLVGSILGRSCIKVANLVPIRQQTWPPKAILVSDWLISKKSSSLKPLCQMNRNLIGSILGKSSIKIAHLVLIVNKHNRHRPFLFLIGRFQNIFFSVTALPNDQNLVGSTYGRFCIKFPQSRMKGERHRLSSLSL